MIKSRRLKCARHVARMDESRNDFKILTGKPTEKRPLGRPRHKGEDNFKMDHKETDVNMKNWFDSA